MGRIKQIYLKRVAQKLVKEHADELSLDFNGNKKKVQEYTDIISVPNRNKIAGCITRIMKVRSKKVE